MTELTPIISTFKKHFDPCGNLPDGDCYHHFKHALSQNEYLIVIPIDDRTAASRRFRTIFGDEGKWLGVGPASVILEKWPQAQHETLLNIWIL